MKKSRFVVVRHDTDGQFVESKSGCSCPDLMHPTIASAKKNLPITTDVEICELIPVEYIHANKN